jgi:hypothetical protein
VAEALLRTTLDVDQRAGSNLADEADDGLRFLLPSLRPAHVHCRRPPPLRQLLALAQAADQVTVQGPAWRARAAGALMPARWPDNVTWTDGPPAEEATCTVDLGRGTGPVGRLDLLPAAGSVHAATPAGDEAARAFLRDTGLDRAAGGGPRYRKALRRAMRVVPRRFVVDRWLLVEPEGPRLPAYVREVAAAAGQSLGDARWAMAAPGRYRSKKVVFLVLADDGRPVQVVKLTRHPDLNPRLENEWATLCRLRDVGFAGAPEPRFLGYHAGLALLGQAAVHGRPMDPADPELGTSQVDTAVARLTQLGVATRRPVATADAAGALSEIVDRLVALEVIGPPEEGVLRASVEAVADSADPFPAVLQHGDPGAWNVLVDGDEVVFLDWEAGDPGGMPLWDLLHLLRSCDVRVARAAGTRDALVGLEQAWGRPSPARSRLTAAVATYVDRVELDPTLVTPLSHLAWAHRALKEATRLAPEQVASGHYVRLLRLGMQRPFLSASPAAPPSVLRSP